MTDYAIRVENLRKRYRIVAGPKTRSGTKTLRDALAWRSRLLARNVKQAVTGIQQEVVPVDEFWALDGVSFDVKRGEVMGIIGRNGAGKSTLLKILSRITEPTAGRIELRGRIGSLLEVGTGFHPELSGRENIYLNGAILGMRRAEIARKFDEIVAFSEIDKFLDTPVKRYSSGMYVRLAFAVAAHLEPEILLVDEVLAVGDAAFQKKCLGKMGDVAKEGRTVLFVSHNMTAVRNICNKAVWLHQGRVQQIGDIVPVTEQYFRQSQAAGATATIEQVIAALPADPAIRLLGVEVSQRGQPGLTIMNGEPVEIAIRYAVLQRTPGLRVSFDLLDQDQSPLIRSFYDEKATEALDLEPGEYLSTAVIPANLLAPRQYEIRLRATVHNVRTCTGEGVGIPLIVEQSRAGNPAYAGGVVPGKLQPDIPWTTSPIMLAAEYGGETTPRHQISA